MAKYNQQLQEDTYYACSVYAFLNMIKYDFGIWLKLDWILKIVMYMEKIWALLPKWAYASVIFPAFLKYVNWKTGFVIEMDITTVDKIDPDKWYILWFKKANRLYLSVAKDWEITKEDIDNISLVITYIVNHYFQVYSQFLIKSLL